MHILWMHFHIYKRLSHFEVGVDVAVVCTMDMGQSPLVTTLSLLGIFFIFLENIFFIFSVLFFYSFYYVSKYIIIFQKLTFHGGIYYFIKISIILKNCQATRNI
jgi:hypothetical protein